MSAGLVQAAYIVSAVLFIMSLAGLSKQETARSGNYYGMTGMAIALIATIFGPDSAGTGWIIVAMAIGAAIGLYYAKKVEMTEMPELVAILHSFVGMAAVLVGYNSYIDHGVLTGAMLNIHLVEVFLGIFIGAVTFTGSLVAFGKLRGVISSSALQLPHRHKLNLVALIASAALLYYFVCNYSSHSNCFCVRLPFSCFNWWRRYASGCFNAEFIFWLGSSSSGFHAFK